MKAKRGSIAIALVIVLVLANIFSPFKVGQISIRLASEPVFSVGGWHITNTLLSSWLAMGLLTILAFASTRKLVQAPAPHSLQNIIETGFEALLNFMQSMVGPKAWAFFPVVGTFFLFILVSNWLGMVPGFGSIGFWEEQEGKRLFIPLLRGSTSDLNTTIALALCSVISLQAYGIHFQGLVGYGSRFVGIGKWITFFRGSAKGEKVRIGLLLGGVLDIFIGILEIFEDLTKVLSFSFRLFGNVFGAEVLLVVIAFLAPYAASLPFLLLEIFGGFIQAFIFAVLTTAFLGRATASHNHEGGQGEGSSTLPTSQAKSFAPR